MDSKREKRARILSVMKQSWRSLGKPESCHIVDWETGEIDLANAIPELNLPKGTVLRQGAVHLDVDEIIRKNYVLRCIEEGLYNPDRVEALSFSVNQLCTSLLPAYIAYPTGTMM